MEKKKLNYFSRQILRRRGEILAKLVGLEQDLNSLEHNHPKDWAEVNNDTLERETIMQKIDTERENLREANSALRKMIDGKYGDCVCCGGRIPEARLRALPLASLCIKCKVEEERWVVKVG